MMPRYPSVDGRVGNHGQGLQAARRSRHAAVAVSARQDMTMPLVVAGLVWLALGAMALA